MGGFSEDNLLSIDQRGFKTLIQKEAESFLQPSQFVLNATVTTIKYNSTGVEVTLEDGRKFGGDYALCTFSAGVLQNDDVKFEPELPDWKREAIESTTMVGFSGSSVLKMSLIAFLGYVYENLLAIPQEILVWYSGE